MGMGSISIHASREGSDRLAFPTVLVTFYFNPRFPRGKRHKKKRKSAGRKNFNPRFPRGKRQRRNRRPSGGGAISIHASREGSDFVHAFIDPVLIQFQSTLPAREATLFLVEPSGPLEISIHASREGSDIIRMKKDITDEISIHASREGSDHRPHEEEKRMAISIHASREGSDQFKTPQIPIPFSISIHASREGSDFLKKVPAITALNFNPRFPRGKRPTGSRFHQRSEGISIHASREGSDSAIKAAPIYRTWHHGFREPEFSGSFHRRFPYFFPLGTGGSRLPNVRHIEASHFFYYTISNGCRLLFPCLYILKVP